MTMPWVQTHVAINEMIGGMINCNLKANYNAYKNPGIAHYGHIWCDFFLCAMLYSLNAGIKLHTNTTVAVFLFCLINILILCFFVFLLDVSVLRIPVHLCVSTLHRPVTGVVTIVKRFVMFMLQIFTVKMRSNFREYQVWCHAISPVIIGKYRFWGPCYRVISFISKVHTYLLHGAESLLSS